MNLRSILMARASMLVYLLALCIQFLHPLALAEGPGGLDSGSFSFCGASINSYQKKISEIPGYTVYKNHLEKIKLRLPTLALNLSLIEEFTWFYFPIKNNGNKCKFIEKSGKAYIKGMEGMGIFVEQPITFNKDAKQIYVREDLFSKQADPGMQLFNEAVRNLCSQIFYDDSTQNICVLNSRVVLEKIDKYKSGDEVLVQLIKLPNTLTGKNLQYGFLYGYDIVGLSTYIGDVAIEMARDKLQALEEIKNAWVQSEQDFKNSNQCLSVPEFRIDYDSLSPKWYCQFKDSGIFLDKDKTRWIYGDKDTALENKLKNRQEQNLKIWAEAMPKIEELDLSGQSLELIRKYYQPPGEVDARFFYREWSKNFLSLDGYFNNLKSNSVDKLAEFLKCIDDNIKKTSDYLFKLEKTHSKSDI